MDAKTRVCILTSSHTAYDERFFHKQAKCLAGAGYDVTIVAPHHADEVANGIRIKAVAGAKSRHGRLLLNPVRVLAAGIREKAAIYHFHDPELIPAGLVLRLMGKKVIYDSHEYYKLKLLSRRRIPAVLRRLAAWSFDVLETLASLLFSGVVVVDSVTEVKFGGKATVVSNYPYKGAVAARAGRGDGIFRCVYVGGLSEDRGLFKMIEAMEYADSRVRLVLAGRISDNDLERAGRLKGFERVDYLGWIPWNKVLELLPGCDLGLVLLQPTPAYIYAGENTVKLFEYMSAGLPVLGSRFPNLEKIISETGCGVTVDPTDPVEIARRISLFAENPEASSRMGNNGRSAVADRYNWEAEAGKLLGLYDTLTGATPQ